jgi:hypothetical protein
VQFWRWKLTSTSSRKGANWQKWIGIQPNSLISIYVPWRLR